MYFERLRNNSLWNKLPTQTVSPSNMRKDLNFQINFTPDVHRFSEIQGNIKNVKIETHTQKQESFPVKGQPQALPIALFPIGWGKGDRYLDLG